MINWFPNPATIAGSVIVNKAVTPVVEPVVEPIVSKVQNAYNEITGSTPPKSMEDYLLDIHILLVESITWLKNQPSVTGDDYKTVQFSKFGKGPPVTPEHLDNRMHFVVFSPVQIVLNVFPSAGLKPFNITLTPASWTVIDFPDGSQYQIDQSYSLDTEMLYIRETNSSVV